MPTPPAGGKSPRWTWACRWAPPARIVRVFGDRKVYVTGSGIAFTAPVPFDRMPLDYGLAYGGKDDKSEEGVPYVYPKNPVGKGFVVKNNLKALQDLILPNLEDPAKLLTPQNLVLQKFERWNEWPDPVGFGCTGKNFHPRYTLAGLPPDQQASVEMERQSALQKMPQIGTGAAGEPPPPIADPQPAILQRRLAGPGLPLPGRQRGGEARQPGQELPPVRLHPAGRPAPGLARRGRGADPRCAWCRTPW